MPNFLSLFSRYQSTRQNWGSLPSWARLILIIFALPGLLAAALSLLAMCVNILALLLLTSPVYHVLAWLTGVSGAPRMQPVDEQEPRVRRHVDVTIIEDPQA